MNLRYKEQKTDIVFSGLGWVTVNDQEQKCCSCPKGVGVSLRKSLI